MTGYTIEEYVVDRHFRVVKILTDDSILYSIDVYQRLLGPTDCDAAISNGDARLCYKKITEQCEALILETPGRVELVNLRLTARTGLDPAGGDPERARQICLEELSGWLEK